MLETLIVPARSPPVPQVSTGSMPSGRVMRSAASSMAWRRATSSSTVSPFMRRPTTKPAIWAGLASPARISPIAARATAGSRSRPAVTSPSTAGQPANGSVTRAGDHSVGPATLADDPATFLLGGATPDPVPLPRPQGVLEASLLHGALAADGLGSRGLFLRHRIEDLRVESPTCSLVVPDLGDSHRFRSAPLGSPPVSGPDPPWSARRSIGNPAPPMQGELTATSATADGSSDFQPRRSSSSSARVAVGSSTSWG